MSRLLNLAVFAALTGSAFAPANAQGPTLTPVPATQVSSAESPERIQAFEELARDVAAMQPQLGLITRVVKLVTPSVVHIEARPLKEFRVRSDMQEAGSGVVVNFDGANYLLTNRHVIKNSAEPYIRIQLADGRVTTPNRIWSDENTDVAVMQVSDTRLPPAHLGNSDTVEIGEYVLAVGSPFGLSQSVTRGIISAKGRYNLDLGDGAVDYQNFLQTDAAINPGNSGGPLINMRGEVVGLNTAIASNSGGNEGIGFSIPINIVTRIARQLITGREIAWGFLGVKLDGYFDEQRAKAAGLPQLVGARVKGVEPNSPAALAELREDDVIIAFDGVRIEDDEHLISLVKLAEIGRPVEVVVVRGGSPWRTRVELSNRPASELSE